MQYEIPSYVDGQSVYHLQGAGDSNIQINLSLDKCIYKDVPLLDLFRISDPTVVRQSAESWW
jgi:hypothetical protein